MKVVEFFIIKFLLSSIVSFLKSAKNDQIDFYYLKKIISIKNKTQKSIIKRIILSVKYVKRKKLNR